MTDQDMNHSDSIDVACEPQQAWDTIRQLERMGEWSPENTGGAWKTGDGLSVGDEFDGVNKIGDREWTATATIIQSDPGEAFVWRVGDPGTEWGYRFEAIDGGTRVTESWTVHQMPEVVASYTDEQRAARFATVRAGMRTTLENFKATLES